ncbi:MAG: LysM peptidoglycan-binding domain-containing protein [Bacillota bacterium]
MSRLPGESGSDDANPKRRARIVRKVRRTRQAAPERGRKAAPERVEEEPAQEQRADQDRAAREALLEPRPRRRRRLRLLPVAAHRYLAIGVLAAMVGLGLAGYQSWRVVTQGRELARVQHERDALAQERDGLARELETIRSAAAASTAATAGEQASRVYVVKAGDSLWDIAARLYGNGRMYTIIALQNKLSDPARLEEGRVLVIPPVKPGP